jgi:serine/threonine protein kinase
VHFTAPRERSKLTITDRCFDLFVRALYQASATAILSTHISVDRLFSEKTEQGDFPENVFMVFEYLEYDLTGVLDTPEIRFSADHIKSWARQLLTGVHFMHKNNILHRDLKPSNLLINSRGELKIADWGLARSWNGDKRRLTTKVITLWYRPPELLLGTREYTSKIDMWSVGCIIAEMFIRGGLFKGQTEAQQLDVIFRTLGHPTAEEWPTIDSTCRLWSNFKPDDHAVLPNRFREVMTKRVSQKSNPKWLTDNAMVMLIGLLRLNPENRWSAEKALDADYFFEDPVVKPADKLGMNFIVKSIHEWDCKRKHDARRP